MLYFSPVPNQSTEGKSHMNAEELKARLRSLLHQRDMLAYERDSFELFDLMEEVDEEIQELTRELRKAA